MGTGDGGWWGGLGGRVGGEKGLFKGGKGEIRGETVIKEGFRAVGREWGRSGHGEATIACGGS